MNKVKLNVAKYMAQEPGKGFTIYDPYISGEDRFKQEQENQRAAQRLNTIMINLHNKISNQMID